MSEPGKIILVSFGSKEYGYGHISRTKFLAKCFQKNHVIVEKIQNINPFEENEIIIIKDSDDYEQYVLSAFDLITKGNHQTLLLDLPFTEFLRDAIFSKLMKESSRKIIALDFFDYDSKRVDVIINLFNHQYYGQSTCVLYSGLKYAIIRDEFSPFRRKEYRTTDEKPLHILISCGGTDPTNKAALGLDFCQSIHEKGTDIDVVVITKNEIKGNLSFPCARKSLSNHFPELLSNADIAIVSGGTTALESCFVGTPIITLSQNREEQIFFEWLESIGLGLCYHSKKLNQILDPYYREKMSIKQRENVDQLGANRIWNIIREFKK